MGFAILNILTVAENLQNTKCCFSDFSQVLLWKIYSIFRLITTPAVNQKIHSVINPDIYYTNYVCFSLTTDVINT